MRGVQGDAIRAQACNSETSRPCRAMVGYQASANFDLFQVASRFSLNDNTSVLGPNDIDPSLWAISDLVLPPQAKPYLIPTTCGCIDGTRVVTWVNYTVVEGDTLSAIAAAYLNLVTYTEIAQASGILNPDLIQVGQEISIPIPCACFNQTSSNSALISLSYQVQRGDSLSYIAQLYNTSALQLQELNTLANASDELEAQKVLFVPLPVCKANFSSGAMDGNLTVVEGAYELTANACVQCNCNNGLLHCIPTPSTFGRTCSNLTCASSMLYLGASNASQGSQECLVESCVYKGYTTQSNIVAVLEVKEDLTCPGAPPPETFYKPPTGLVASPLDSPLASSSTLSPPPSPSTSIAIPPSTNTNPSIASPLLGGISFFAWGCLFSFWLSLSVQA
ncbi:hypothetical protein GOP47_0006573 [Adiantum capillus-veneris]|uniref:LysM domain-containing protein n=1 Tax=Adiantum capillus-veneris TaxID=13818 RepID=A0A9D4V3X2_ADICA|nr:hypothetical protein GOP47_0006573 [Adiantum capillus-veneris]